MRGWTYNLLDRLTDWLVDLMIMLEPKRPRRQELDYHVSVLPDEILAIIRISWYKDGKPDSIDEVVLMEDGQDGYDAFAEVVTSALHRGANLSIRSGYSATDLGIMQ
jgi:hypothetical protein